MVSSLVVNENVEKIASVDSHIGVSYAGLGPDFRVLLKSARKHSQSYQLRYGESAPIGVIVRQVADEMQEYTQSGGVRPFGVSVLVAGISSSSEDNSGKPFLFQIDPSGNFFAWKGCAIGKNMLNAKTFLERRFASVESSQQSEDEGMELEDAIHTALLALKDSFDGQMTEHNIEVGIAECKSGSFFKLSPERIREYLDNL